MRMWSNGNSHFLLMGTQNGTATLEDSLVLSHKTKHILTIWFNNHALRYLPKGAENLCSHGTCTQMFFVFVFVLFIYLFIYLFILAVLGLRFCATAFSSCGKRGPLFIAVRGPLSIVASLVAEHRLQMCRLSSCGSRAQLLRGMWDPPRPGLEPVSPALAGRFSTTAPPGKPHTDVYSSLIHNCQNLEATKMSFNGWMGK